MLLLAQQAARLCESWIVSVAATVDAHQRVRPMEEAAAAGNTAAGAKERK